MNNELQDRAWESLPKETQKEIVRIYYDTPTEYLNRRLLKHLFGHHNIELYYV